MTTNEFISFYKRELNNLIAEIESYKNEANIWRIEKNVTNSAGNLTLHLIGNLHTFIGKEIGKTGYIRNRELEFSQKRIPRTELINAINETIEMLEKSLHSITNEALKNDYPLLKFAKVETNEYLLVHLLKHFTYYLGQINYHRRLLDA